MGSRWKHFKTICKHKHEVMKVCWLCGITWQGIIHDLSKFSPVEFNSSAKYFQGNRSPIEAEKKTLDILRLGYIIKVITNIIGNIGQILMMMVLSNVLKFHISM